MITNYHVIEEAKFVEMRLYDGQETFGKVIDSDVRLDLALIRVQARGKPAALSGQRDLDLGAGVEAIGHPNGKLYSITRGVISSVRESPNALGVGGKPVLFVQTDAAINRGNSGGPLFLGDEVIGVNTWGIRKDVSEGLNFAVHHAEVRAFLARSAATN